MRDYVWDKPKPVSQLKKEQGKSCSTPSCNNPLTHMKGPGEHTLCRECQLKLVEYGGVGRLDRPHTFHRKWVCDMCGIDVMECVRTKYPALEDINPELFNRLCRNRIIGDHIVRKADGGSDSEDNIQSLCLSCNSDKTILSEDWKRGKSYRRASSK
jgi:5-methylcytosine-specific restriction endonuclease McrA